MSELDQVRREIEQEVRARRAAGAYPPGFERELDELFARFAPPAASGDFDAVLDQAEEAASISPVIPTDSQKPAGAYVKKGLGKAIGWYHAWMVQQVVGFAGSTVRAVRILGRRVRAVEGQLGDARYALDSLADVAPRPLDDAAIGAVVQTLTGVRGRVLVAESGDGALLRALVAAGIDAYACEPRAGLVADQRDEGLEVRAEDARFHLAAVGAGELAAVVLAGCVERLASGALVAIGELAASRVGDDGVVVVVSLAPEAFVAADPVAADLAPGRPLHAATWVHLLQRQGLSAEVIDGGRTDAVIVARRAPT